MKRLNPQIIAGLVLVGAILIWNIATRIYLKDKHPILGIWKRTTDDNSETLYLISENTGSLSTVRTSENAQGAPPTYQYMDNFEWHEQSGRVKFQYHIPTPQTTDVTRPNNTVEEYRFSISYDHKTLSLINSAGDPKVFTRQ